MKIRRVDSSREDIRHTLNTLDRECFPADELCSKNGWWWFAYMDDEPIAFAGMRHRVTIEPGVGYLCRVGVRAKYRGQGIQKQLIRVRLSYARRQGLKYLITDTTQNFASANNLISTGFKLYEPAYPWSMPDSLYWNYEL